MRKILAFGSLFTFMAIVTSEADAQRVGGGFGFGGGGGGVMLLANKGVQEELKITDDQKEKITSVAKETGTKMGELRGKFKDLPEEERKEKTQKAVKEIQEIALKEVSLKPEQMKRLKQIERQQNALTTLTTDEEVVKELKVTDEQKEKLKAISEAVSKELAEMRGGGRKGKNGGGFNKEAFEKMTTARTEASDKAIKLLTTEQQSKWKELTGAPFTVRFEGGFQRRGKDSPKESKE